MRRFDEEKAELQTAVETRQAEVTSLRKTERELKEAEKGTRAELQRLDKEKAELEAGIEARRTAVEKLRIETDALTRRLDEEKAQLEAAIETRQVEVARLCEVERELGEVENGTRTELQRLDEEKAQLEAAVGARHVEVERLRMDAERRLNEAQNRNRAEHEQLRRQTGELERLTGEVAKRRAEVEASLHKANEENGRLLEMQQAEERSRQEVLWLEPEICERSDVDQPVLEVEDLYDEAKEHDHFAPEELERISSDARVQAIPEEQMPNILEEMRSRLVAATQATAHLADLPDEEGKKLRSVEREQEKPIKKRKSVAVSRFS
jgi:chromosome segregation ATPase